MLETQITTLVLCSADVQRKPCPFDASLSTADTLKILDENDTAFKRHDHEIAAILGDMGYARCGA